MTTLPPSNLAPESTPWGRAVEEGLVSTEGKAESANISVANALELQKALGITVETGLQSVKRDINGVNEQLSRVYDRHEGKLTTLEGRMDSAFEYLTQFSALLGNHGPRIGALEAKLTFRTASSIDGLQFLADGGSGAIWKVPQSVGSPLGGPIKWPFNLAYVTDDYGPRDSPGGIGSTYHRAYDFAGGGTDIKAVGRGTVIFAGDNGGLGNHIEIRHSPTLVTGYSHLASIGVSVGQAVAQGQSIGVMGTTGTSTGVHLHFATSINGVLVNPRDVIVGDDHV